MVQSILGEPTRVEKKKFNTLAEAGVETYQGDFFGKCFPDMVNAVVDSTAALVTQLLLRPATSLEIVAAAEERQLVSGISRNQLAYFLLKNKGCGGWFVAHVIDEVRDETDEADSFVSGSERLVLRTVKFYWSDDRLDLDADRVSDPHKWPAGIHVLSRNPSASQS